MRRPAVMRGARGFRRERGAVMVEFGIVFPVMMMIVFAVIDFSRAYYYLNNITSAVREGARYGAVLPGPDTSSAQRAEIRNVVRSFSISFGGDSITDSDIVIDSAVTATGEIGVTVNYKFATITPLAGLVGLDTIPMAQRAVFRWERAGSP